MGIMKASIKFYRVCHTQKAKKKNQAFREEKPSINYQRKMLGLILNHLQKLKPQIVKKTRTKFKLITITKLVS